MSGQIHDGLTQCRLAGFVTKAPNPFRHFDASPEVIPLAIMISVSYPLSLCNVEEFLFERGINICQESVRLWWNLFGPTNAMVTYDLRAYGAALREIGAGALLRTGCRLTNQVENS